MRPELSDNIHVRLTIKLYLRLAFLAMVAVLWGCGDKEDLPPLEPVTGQWRVFDEIDVFVDGAHDTSYLSFFQIAFNEDLTGQYIYGSHLVPFTWRELPQRKIEIVREVETVPLVYWRDTVIHTVVEQREGFQKWKSQRPEPFVVNGLQFHVWTLTPQ